MRFQWQHFPLPCWSCLAPLCMYYTSCQQLDGHVWLLCPLFLLHVQIGLGVGWLTSLQLGLFVQHSVWQFLVLTGWQQLKFPWVECWEGHSELGVRECNKVMLSCPVCLQGCIPVSWGTPGPVLHLWVHLGWSSLALLRLGCVFESETGSPVLCCMLVGPPGSTATVGIFWGGGFCFVLKVGDVCMNCV